MSIAAWIVEIFFASLIFIKLERDRRKYSWVQKQLIEPLSKFRKDYTYSTPSVIPRYRLTETTESHFAYYNLFDKKPLEDLLFDIRYRIKETQNTNNFASYLTGGIIPMIALIYAGLSLTIGNVSSIFILDTAVQLGAISFFILSILALDYLTKSTVTSTLEKDAFVIEEVLKGKLD